MHRRRAAPCQQTCRISGLPELLPGRNGAVRGLLGAAPLTADSIGKALRALRDASGLTGDAVARRASMSAGKLSKIETGKVRPTVQDVDLVLTATGVSQEVKAEFLAAARAEATEATAWRLLRRMGPWKHQKTIRAIEAAATTLRLFQGQLIPDAKHHGGILPRISGGRLRNKSMPPQILCRCTGFCISNTRARR
ncbi:helix-turn-helix domain-containing protein [Streptomyces wuyuanensis]|uniref:helix-turn-helix domain-containing protein n=1 Tax=Streptomyces wuyuanensis TaxID=1196353 RepID=UPI00341A0438